MKLSWNFQRGGEVLENIPSMGEVWIFSGTTHLKKLRMELESGEIFYTGYCDKNTRHMSFDRVSKQIEVIHYSSFE